MSDLEVQELFEHVFDDEPPHIDSVSDVYRRAENLRRRRARAVIASGAATVVLVALAGYGFASAMLPRLGPALAEGSVRDDSAVPGSVREQPAVNPTAAEVGPGGVERVQTLVSAVLRDHGLELAPEVPEAGDGWRRFRIVGPVPDPDDRKPDPDDERNDENDSGSGGADPELDPVAAGGKAGEVVEADNGDRSGDEDGGPGDDAGSSGDTGTSSVAAVEGRGTIHVAVYTAPGGLCFPVTSTSERVCARPVKLAGGVEYARYTDDDDVDAQVAEVIARRRSDGRTVAVMVSGVPDTGDADQGRPPLTALEAAALALDRRLPDAFGSDEWCDRPDPDCPALTVPLPDEA